MRLKKYISVEKASQHSRFTPATLSEICASGFVEAKNINRRWFISEADCEKRLASDEIMDWASSLERFQKFRAALAVVVGLIFLASLFFWSLPQPQPTFLQASLAADGIDIERILIDWQHFLGSVTP